jgi:hypothetical protein
VLKIKKEGFVMNKERPSHKSVLKCIKCGNSEVNRFYTYYKSLCTIGGEELDEYLKRE